MNSNLRHLGALSLLVLLCGCPAGSGTSVAGIDRGGITVGTVTGFGSVYVNGRRYLTDQSVVTVDGAPASTADLNLGYVVRIDALFPDDGSDPDAQSIDYSSLLTGPIESIDLAGSRLVALGQTVFVSGETYFDAAIPGGVLDGLAIGQVVRISGFRDASDGIRATRVELAGAAPPFALSGIARNVDTDLKRFEIGGLSVSYSAAASVDGFPQGQPAEGDGVQARGERAGGSGDFLAVSLEYEDFSPPSAAGEEGEIEGLVSRFASAADFDVDGVSVSTSGSTEFENGTAANLALNVRLEVEGRFDADGILVAKKVEFRSSDDLRLEGQLDSVDATAGRLVLLGVTVQASGITNLGALSPGSCVEVRGSESSTEPGVLVASRLEREDSCDETKVRGYVSAVAEPGFAVFGVSVSTDAGTSFPGDSASFFAGAAGRLVSVEGTEANDLVLADRIEFRD